MPPEIIREMETRKLAGAITLTEIVMLSLVLLWTYNTRESLKKDTHYYNIQEKQLKSVETKLIDKQEKIEHLKKLEEESKLVKGYLKQKKYLHLYLKSIPFLVPEKIHLESISWGNSYSDQPIKATSHPANLGQPENGNIITLSGKVDSSLPDEKYSLFFKFLSNLEGSPFVKKVDYHSEDLLTNGLFQIVIYVKEIQHKYGSH
jgi:Tfp pilus assembly protein PilN